jgi:hypothetical protein
MTKSLAVRAIHAINRDRVRPPAVPCFNRTSERGSCSRFAREGRPPKDSRPNFPARLLIASYSHADALRSMTEVVIVTLPQLGWNAAVMLSKTQWNRLI